MVEPREADRVATGLAVNDGAVIRAENAVVAVAAIHGVGAVGDRDRVVAAIAVDDGIGVGDGDQILAVGRIDRAGAAKDRVGAAADQDRVLANVAVDQPGAVADREGIVADAAMCGDLGRDADGKRIVAAAEVDRVDAGRRNRYGVRAGRPTNCYNGHSSTPCVPAMRLWSRPHPNGAIPRASR